MKTLALGALAAIALALGVIPEQASAGWVYKTGYRWDPTCCRYVTYRERCWVPDCGPVVPVCDRYPDPYCDRYRDPFCDRYPGWPRDDYRSGYRGPVGGPRDPGYPGYPGGPFTGPRDPGFPGGPGGPRPLPYRR